ncbi:hypothetical protein [Bathymodiolus septemdierum thioautotrophic gill symbiont]|uniref:Methyl-accepting chemotaxis protein n=1 Tax=endosymbiont of Bathymodiolus septemdierum str. Myojin knoll TaxID=1303921 RepID=A0A0P0URD8_9GAMM|nr:hypothetical protein [Bathymodiolus septemdierum thioautotrophic gill symbiont]BAS67654.1 conserved hypothetical protein [endosymbiont of Bathymodiolus septemdierum str. Myojin knoll]
MSNQDKKDDDKINSKHSKVADDEVMITTKMSDLERMLEGVEEQANKRTDSKFERFFMPALIVFALLAFGGFWIIYSITTDMTKLAKAMDPKMGTNMTSMVTSIDSVSNSVVQMNLSVANMRNDIHSMSKNMENIAHKLNRLDDISSDMSQINGKMSTLKPMLANMQEMNGNMIGMQKSMLWMQKDISQLRSSFSKPMRVFNSVPFL